MLALLKTDDDVWRLQDDPKGYPRGSGFYECFLALSSRFVSWHLRCPKKGGGIAAYKPVAFAPTHGIWDEAMKSLDSFRTGIWQKFRQTFRPADWIRHFEPPSSRFLNPKKPR